MDTMEQAPRVQAFLGLRAWELDPGGVLVRALALLGLAHGVRRPSREHIVTARSRTP